MNIRFGIFSANVRVKAGRSEHYRAKRASRPIPARVRPLVLHRTKLQASFMVFQLELDSFDAFVECSLSLPVTSQATACYGNATVVRTFRKKQGWLIKPSSVADVRKNN